MLYQDLLSLLWCYIFECKAEAPGWHRASSSSTCPAPWWTESCRYAVSTEDNDISKALHLHYYEKRRTEVHYQNHSYTLYTATLPPGILAVKEQERSNKGILRVCSLPHPQRVSLGSPSPWADLPQFPPEIMKGNTWWPLHSRKRSAAFTDMKLLEAMHWLAAANGHFAKGERNNKLLQPTGISRGSKHMWSSKVSF